MDRIVFILSYGIPAGLLVYILYHVARGHLSMEEFGRRHGFEPLKPIRELPFFDDLFYNVLPFYRPLIRLLNQKRLLQKQMEGGTFYAWYNVSRFGSFRANLCFAFVMPVREKGYFKLIRKPPLSRAGGGRPFESRFRILDNTVEKKLEKMLRMDDELRCNILELGRNPHFRIILRDDSLIVYSEKKFFITFHNTDIAGISLLSERIAGRIGIGLNRADSDLPAGSRGS